MSNTLFDLHVHVWIMHVTYCIKERRDAEREKDGERERERERERGCGEADRHVIV